MTSSRKGQKVKFTYCIVCARFQDSVSVKLQIFIIGDSIHHYVLLSGKICKSMRKIQNLIKTLKRK